MTSDDAKVWRMDNNNILSTIVLCDGNFSNEIIVVCEHFAC